MKNFILFLVLIGLIVFSCFIFYSPPKEVPHQSIQSSTLPEPLTKKMTIPSKTLWDTSTLKLRKALSQKSGLSEKKLSYQDVQFYQKYPDFHFFKVSSYSILAEKKSFSFQSSLTALREYAIQFRQFYSPLITQIPHSSM